MEPSLVPAQKGPTWNEGKEAHTAEKEGLGESQGISRKGHARMTKVGGWKAEEEGGRERGPRMGQGWGVKRNIQECRSREKRLPGL